MPFYRCAEISTYALLNFLPFIFIYLYIIKDHLRFSKPTVALVVGMLAVLNITNLMIVVQNDALSFLGPLTQLTEAVFFIVMVRQHIGKSLFLLMMLSNVATNITLCAKCMEMYLFPEFVPEKYRWTFCLCYFVICVLFLVPLLFYIRKIYIPTMRHEQSKRIWRYVWAIPATFYLVWYHRIMVNDEILHSTTILPISTMILLAATVGSFLIYHIVIILINEQTNNLKLKDNESKLLLQQAQYESITEKIEETRKIHHDLKHHVKVISSYIDNHQRQELIDYLAKYNAYLSANETHIYCENLAVNALLQYFSERSADNCILFSAVTSVPFKISVPDDALTVIIGNLLENAVEACQSEPPNTAKITVRIKTDPDFIYINVSNTYHGEIQKNSDGSFLSTKHHGRGIGLHSVQSIVSKYHGTVRFDYRNDVFSVYAILSMMV